MALTIDGVHAIALELPATELGTSYGDPAVKVRKKFLTRVNEKEQGIVIFTETIEDRDLLLEAAPDIYFITDHYKNYPAALMHLSVATRDELWPHLVRRWKSQVTKKMLKEFEEG